MYNGYRLCSDHFAENAYADPAKTRLLWTAVPTAAVEVGSPIDEGPSRAEATEATAGSAQDHPAGQKSVVQVVEDGPETASTVSPGSSSHADNDSSQFTPVYPESPVAQRPRHLLCMISSLFTNVLL
ncbi:uncharacterized protein LOC125942111 [Dermacentor silvarum]|uniref:uncharacterized protein LOC125942111 n=1 Tax=Dermacentor silvarum TaxID=543639 RepID=UPI0021012B27|nr:uncharacterized protein LOC125942111 [Dermacentor silvarum]